MLYFKVVVFPSGPLDRGHAPGEGIAHVMTDVPDVEIEAAAAMVVRRLHADGWRISHVLEARPLTRGAKFYASPMLNTLVDEAADSGYAFHVAQPTEESAIAPFHPGSELDSLPALDDPRESQRAG